MDRQHVHHGQEVITNDMKYKTAAITLGVSLNPRRESQAHDRGQRNPGTAGEHRKSACEPDWAGGQHPQR